MTSIYNSLGVFRRCVSQYSSVKVSGLQLRNGIQGIHTQFPSKSLLKTLPIRVERAKDGVKLNCQLSTLVNPLYKTSQCGNRVSLIDPSLLNLFKRFLYSETAFSNLVRCYCRNITALAKGLNVAENKLCLEDAVRKFSDCGKKKKSKCGKKKKSKKCKKSKSSCKPKKKKRKCSAKKVKKSKKKPVPCIKQKKKPKRSCEDDGGKDETCPKKPKKNKKSKKKNKCKAKDVKKVVKKKSPVPCGKKKSKSKCKKDKKKQDKKGKGGGSKSPCPAPKPKTGGSEKAASKGSGCPKPEIKASAGAGGSGGGSGGGANKSGRDIQRQALKNQPDAACKRANSGKKRDTNNPATKVCINSKKFPKTRGFCFPRDPKDICISKGAINRNANKM